MMTDSKILEVVQAHKEGKQIQSRLKDGCYHELGWLPLPVGTTIYWNFIKTDYRVVPEPRKPREWELPLDYLVCGQNMTKFDPSIPREGPLVFVKVREVIE